jgi:hypothetical protein
MSIENQWPDYAPDITLKVDITSGVMTLVSPSTLVNYADFDHSAPDIRGTVFKNGARVGPIAINSSTGALSMSSVNVSNGDHVMFEFQAIGIVSLPWNSRLVMSRMLFLDVPAGNTQITFDGSNNTMPIPGYDFAFGWSSGNLKAALKVASSDSASQSPVLYTRLFGTSPDQESSTTISLANTSTAQVQTSGFADTAMVRDVEIELFWKSGTGSTRQEERFRMIWSHRDDVPPYPSSFPSSGRQLVIQKVNGGTKLYQP